jgi:glycosyltransferase involved in cell wall biosynthesis
MSKPSISVIVPTRNRSNLLRKFILSLISQTIDKELFEVIVCDNASSDDTKQVCATFFQDLNLKYLFVKDPGLHNGRHAGLHASTSDILVYADDDIEASPIWLETILQTFTLHKDIVLIGGNNQPNFEMNPPFWLFKKWANFNEGIKMICELSIIYLGEKERFISPYHVFGCNFSVRKNIVIDAGGFHPDGMPGDLIKFRGDGETHISNFIHKNNLKAYFHPGASVNHFVSSTRMTEDYFCRWHFNAGISDAYANLRKGKTQKAQIFEHKKNLFKVFKYIKYIVDILYLTDFEKKLKLSYVEGYNFLIDNFTYDIEVKEWVSKKNYF